VSRRVLAERFYSGDGQTWCVSANATDLPLERRREKEIADSERERGGGEREREDEPM